VSCPHLNRARAILGGAALCTVALAGGACGHDVLQPTSDTAAAAANVPRAHDGDASFSGTVSVDPTNASGGIDLNSYADWTLVDITVSGLVTQHHNTLGTDLQFGPMGLPNCSAGYTITYGGTLAVLFPCPSGGAPEPSVTRGAVVRGLGRADRSAGPTTCSGFPVPCFRYSGSQTITVTPVPVTVSVRGDFTQAPAGSTITFTSTIIPATLSFGGWWFFMDNGFTYQACPSSNRNTCAMTLFGPGHMEMYANAGPMQRVGTWQVNVGPPIPTDTGGGTGGGSGGGGGGGGSCLRTGPAHGTLAFACDPPGADSVQLTVTVPDEGNIKPSNERASTRYDSNHQLRVHVTNAQGAPLSGQTVAIAVSGDPKSGGHTHDAATAALPNRPHGLVLPAATATTNAAGDATFTYRAPIVSGTEKLTATVAGAAPKTKDLLVAETGIEAVATSGAHYWILPTTNHKPDDNFAAIGVIGLTNGIFDGWAALHAQRPRIYPFAGYPGDGHPGQFRIDAITLPYGGLYDVLGQWTTSPRGHQLHRKGLDVDFNDGPGGAESVPRAMAAFCARREFWFNGLAPDCQVHAPQHYHILLAEAGTGGALRANRRVGRWAASAALGVGALASVVEAQQSGAKRYDPVRGSYFVTVVGDSGNVEVEAVPADRVRATVAATVTPATPTSWRYAYRVNVGPQDAQALDEVEIPCAAFGSARAFAGAGYSRAHGAEGIAAEFVQYPERDVCLASVRDYRAGDSLSVAFTSGAAPALGRVHLLGAVPAVVWPFEIEPQVNGRAKEVVDSIIGLTGGWYEVVAAVPTRSAASLASPLLTVRAMQSDLGAACGPLGLISPAGICNSLIQKLDKAVEAIERGQSNANNHLSAFLHELDAQRGQHVQESAYAVLHALGLLLQGRL